ncbi:SET3 SET domain-containing protein 3 [Candida maltosa Xu316]
MASKDEEQLLQDASTLLMFANVAAKQQSSNQHSPKSDIDHSKPHNTTSYTFPPQNKPVITTTTSAPISVQPAASNHTPRKSSINLLMNTPEPSTTTEAEFKRKSVSPTSGLPKKGSFKPNHERSQSTPEEQFSPSPTFERGIDLRSKERNTKNAELAAAALTAAADIPLPLKVVEQKSILPLSSYQVDPDSGLIGCICGIDDDDGFTIQCDVCFRWQHCVCMGYENGDEVPEDEYKCYYCDERKWGKFDPEKSRLRTLQRLDNDDKQNKSEQQQRQQSPPSQQETSSGKRKQSNPDKPDAKRRKSEEKTNTKFQSPRPDEMDDLPNKDNELLEDGITAESYQSVYYNLKENDYKTQAIKEYIDNLGLEFSKLSKSEQSTTNVTVMTYNQFKALKLSRINLPNYNKYLQEHNKLKKKVASNKTTIEVKAYTDNQKQKFNGISKLSLFISTGGDSLTIPENTPIVEYLGEVDLFKNYCNDRINQYQMWGTTKPKVLKTFVPTTNDKKSLDIVLDSRFVGNESRFIRKSCPTSSNCKIQPVYIPEQNQFRFMVYTSKPITLKSENQDEELRLPWEWDTNHPILKLYENNNQEKFENLTNQEKSALISYVDNILHFVECGCTTSNTNGLCAIFKIKKATSYLLRSTRKASSLSNVNLTKSKEELILPKPEKEYVSWDTRLNQRNEKIRQELLSKEKTIVDTAVSDITEDIIEKPKSLLKIPFHQQLLESVKKGGEVELKAIQEPTPSTSEDDAEPTKEIPIPVIPELMASIDKSIDEKLKPIIKEVEATTHDTEKLVEPIVPEEKKIEKPDPVPPPKVVKKLSFADYKKMK